MCWVGQRRTVTKIQYPLWQVIELFKVNHLVGSLKRFLLGQKMEIGIAFLIAALIVGTVILIVGVAMSPPRGGKNHEKAKFAPPASPVRGIPTPLRSVPETPTRPNAEEPPRTTTDPGTTKRTAAAASSLSATFIEPAEHKPNSKLIYATSAHGAPISSDNRDEWLEARRWGVTATDVKKIVKLNGQPSIQRAGLLEKKLTGSPEREFAVFQHGRDREPIIAEWARQEFGVHHNQFLMCGQNSMHLATPDGIGEEFIVEIKTSVKEVLPTSKMYRDQLQWQLHVTDTERVLLIVENRYSLERETMWVHRNEERIRTLETHADQFLEELHSMRT